MGLEEWVGFQQVEQVKDVPGEEISKSKDLDVGKHQVLSLGSQEPHMSGV